MNIGLVDVDGHNFPNLALMKISAYHKKGDNVEWADPLFGNYNRVYMSKVFTHTPDNTDIYNCEVVKGGTGYDAEIKLPEDIDRMQPDYSLYPNWPKDTAIGFLTRGCIRNCKWCIVPKKEGFIAPYMDIEDVCEHGRFKKAVLLDNNVIACNEGIAQLDKIASLGISVDFNQAMDARLITPEIANVMARIKWADNSGNNRIRFGCDTKKQIGDCERAIDLLQKYGYRGYFFLYTILIDFYESFERINYWRKKDVHRFIPHAQPYLDFNRAKQHIPQWQRDLARWTDNKFIYCKCEFRDFEPRKGFRCQEYFENPELVNK